MTKRLSSAQIRRAFLDYFKRNGHAEVASSSLVPNDATLLFTNAGMVQFKDTFLGLEKRSYTRATTSQKVMRVSGKHNDLENVGPSPRHHTFFEMLGNFSFGDYFKRDAIRFAYEFCTQELGIDPERLRFTVHTSDDEAHGYWLELGVSPVHIYRMGDKTNFWSMGDVGPCGPTSELHYDFGPEACSCHEPDCSVLKDNGCNRWLEIWNLVFMQFDQAADGTRKPLPKPGVDTGMGLERITSVAQGVRTNYDTDLFMGIMDAIQEDLRHDNATRQKNYVAYRVIADHGRAMTFLLADGVLPGNEGAAYVLRMVMRRAMRFGKRMGVQRPFLGDVSRAVIAQMSGHYTELAAKQDFIIKAIEQEEERFQQTLDHGLAVLDDLIVMAQTRNETVIAGRDAFRLWDTYGFPLDLTRDVANERGFTVDEVGFNAALEEQRKQSQAGGKFKVGTREEAYRALNLPETKFVGYETLRATARVLAILCDGQAVVEAKAGDVVEVVLDQTPFYAESGGQVGDKGQLTIGHIMMSVDDVQKPIHGVNVHIGKVGAGVLRVGDTAQASVDATHRLNVKRNHTATHLLHKALHEIIGDHATQKGSLVASDRLRFDFNHLSAVTRDELEKIEARVNQMILLNASVHWYVTTKEDAMRSGAMALFGEKYGDEVRVVCIAKKDVAAEGDVAGVQLLPHQRERGECYSRELCGGTHVDATGEIGAFYLIGESAVGAGVRRIEAVTGDGAREFARQQLALLAAVSSRLQVTPEQAPAKAQALLDELSARRKDIEQLQRDAAKASLETLLNRKQQINGIALVAAQVNAANAEVMRELSDWLRDQLGSGIVVLGAIISSKPSLIVSVTPDLVSRGVKAGDLIKPLAQVLGGSGGGRPNLAQAGGKDASKLGEALRLATSVVESVLQ
jgi:alanyl-tRNA synthetase